MFACDFLDADLESGYVRVLLEMTTAGWSDPEIAAEMEVSESTLYKRSDISSTLKKGKDRGRVRLRHVLWKLVVTALVVSWLRFGRSATRQPMRRSRSRSIKYTPLERRAAATVAGSRNTQGVPWVTGHIV